MRSLLAVVLVVTTMPATAGEQHHTAGPKDSSYAGQETRQIKSLSGEDIAELRRGGGWGLAGDLCKSSAPSLCAKPRNAYRQQGWHLSSQPMPCQGFSLAKPGV